MEYRKLGRAGLKVSELSFGSWVTFSTQLDEKGALDCMAYAYEHGVNFFDNAEVYAAGESEKLMGKAIQKLAWPRDTFCVSSKVFWGGSKPTQLGLSRKHVTDACHAALKRLQVDYLDMYFCHRPDPDCPIDETVRAMHDLISQGKVLYWGTSEWTGESIARAYELAKELGLTPPSMEQPQYNLFHREKVEKEFAPLYQKYGLGTTIWSPLASGILTGKYSNGIPANSRVTLPDYQWLRNLVESSDGSAKIGKTRKLSQLAKEIGCTVSQLSIAWCLKNPNVSTVILGASRMGQLEENIGASEVSKKLTSDIIHKIEEITE
jgi:voltage-dependent potassium channel beta subunit